jgi:hypothetical protein
VIHHLKVAYDEELARESPGLQLEIEMVDAFHRDARLDRIDSCTAPGTVVSEQLYPDRQRMGSVLVPLAQGLRAGFVASVPTMARTFARARSAVART